ncbi:MAG: deaminase [Candidatus Gracilibacteria bacterium]|jgi:dCMP deaminase
MNKVDFKFLEMIDLMEPKAKCIRANIACILVKNSKILIKATNDWHEEINCIKHGCIRNIRNIPSGTQREICYGMCAEQWCLALAAKKGTSVKGATCYVTKHPCRVCESMLTEAGIKRVVYQEGYPDVLPHFNLFKKRKVKVEQASRTSKADPKRLTTHSI